MLTALNIALGLVAAALLVPLGVLCAVLLAALLPRRRPATAAATSERPTVAVLVPAHDEAGGIGRTLDAVATQLVAGDRLLVVADNCRDATADAARRHGAEVVERADVDRRGKGYALDHGVRHLERAGTPPGVVIIVDADVTLRPGAIDALARQVARTNRPAQAVYLMDVPAAPRVLDLISRFAFTLRNLIRPIGLARLGGPCPLFGCGMAFPWETIRTAPLATGNLVEDLALGLDLAAAGHAPRLCEGAQFIGGLPADAAAAEQQRLRWDHGHLSSIASQVPWLIVCGVGGLLRGRASLLVLALDAAVPPVTLLVAATGLAMSAAALAAAFLGAWWWPAVSLAATLGLLAVCLVAVWVRYFRGELPARALVGMPGYLIRRLPAHRSILAGRRLDWVRTRRDHESAPPPPAANGADANGHAVKRPARVPPPPQPSVPAK